MVICGIRKAAFHLERLFIRDRESRPVKAIDQVNIGVCGLGKNVGTTFIASLLAFYFEIKGKRISFTQVGSPAMCSSLLYEAVAMEQRFYGRDFYDIYREISEGNPVRNLQNHELGVNWTLITPFDVADGIELAKDEVARLVGNSKGDICIFDIDVGNDGETALDDMDHIIAVCDPLPSKMSCNLNNFKRLKQRELSGRAGFAWVVNGVNKGVSRRQVKGFLKSDSIVWIDSFPVEEIYSDEYHCRFHWGNKTIKTAVTPEFDKLSGILNV